MTGVVSGVLLILLIVVLIQLRFARAVSRLLGNPEFRSLLLLVVATLAAGTIFYWRVEGWGILDAFYFSVILLTTVGLGDLAPTTTAGKLFTVFYISAGLGIILGFINVVAKASVEQRTERSGVLRRRSAKQEDDRQ